MHARSALFDLYGDHLRHHASQAPVAAILRLLGPVGVNGPAVRTAISRMVSQGWLEPVSLPSGPGYRATARAEQRFDSTATRIYATEPPPWDGTWHILLGDPPAERTRRERLRDDLQFLGYAQISSGAWVSPYPRENLTEILARAGVDPHRGQGWRLDPEPVNGWALDRLALAYTDWPLLADRIVDAELGRGDDPDQSAFTARFLLVHEWRKFLFDDPGLPRELLPADWPGIPAARNFTDAAARLKPAAERFVNRCLGSDPGDGPDKLHP